MVEAVGIGVVRFQPGDEVFGMLSYPYGHGSHAEYVTAPARAFAPKPASLDHSQAGALPLVSLTAWQALVENADLQPGQRVLIHAAAGGVGHVAVQIAKARGAYVIGTASAGKHDSCASIGVDEAIDYRETDFTEAVKDVDVVLDTIGGETSMRSLRVLRPGGVVVSILPVGSADFHEEAERLGVRALRMLVDARTGRHEGDRGAGGGGEAAPRDRRHLPAGRCRRGARARRHRPDHGEAGPDGRLTSCQNVSTGLIALPAPMSRTAWSMSANG